MKGKYIIFSSIITSLVASVCCIGPLILALLGLTGVAAFSFLEPLRPYLISASVILFLFAFYFVYRKKVIVNEDGSHKTITASKRDKITVWIVVAISLIVIVIPLFETQATGTSKNSRYLKSNSTTKNLKINLKSTFANSSYESFGNSGKECCTQSPDTLKVSLTKNKTGKFIKEIKLK